MSINTEEIYEHVSTLQGARYWIGMTDIAKEGTFYWHHGEKWKFSPPWDGGQPGDSNTVGDTDSKRGGQNCNYLSTTHGLHDNPCEDRMEYMCMGHKVQAGLGGQVEGYAVEHGVHCDAGLSYEVSRTIEITDVHLSSSYITAFLPSAYVKIWARFEPELFVNIAIALL